MGNLPNQTSKTQARATAYWILLALGVLFLGPIVAAISFYDAGDNFVPSTLNYGKLITPPPSFASLNGQLQNLPKHTTFTQSSAFKGHWMLMFVAPKECGKTCEKVLLKMRQINLALGKDVKRVKRVVATFKAVPTAILDNILKKNYPHVFHIAIEKNSFDHIAKKFPMAPTVASEGALLLVDPQGNIMMQYGLDDQRKGIYKDLKRLLKVSYVG